MQIPEKYPNSLPAAIILFNQGRSAQKAGNIDKTIEMMTKSIDVFLARNTENTKNLLLTAYFILGESYLKNNDNINAHSNFKSAQKIMADMRKSRTKVIPTSLTPLELTEGGAVL